MSIWVEVEADEAMRSIQKIKEKDMPDFVKEFLGQLALEFRKVMVEMVTNRDINVITGRLRNTIDIFTTSEGIEIGPSVFYARFVARGTKYMKERPFDKWTLDIVEPRIPTIAKTVADKYLMG